MRALVVAGVALAAFPADAATLREALAQTYQTSPVLTAARARLRGVDEGVPIAKAGARLQVSGTVGVTQSYDGLTTLTNGSRVLTGGLNLSYPLFQGGRVRNTINAAESRVVAGRADLRTTEGNLFTDAVAAYMNVVRDQAIVELNANQVKVLETNLRASRDRFQVGDLTRTDVAQSDARLALARSQLASAQGRLTSSREAYRQTVGVWPDKLEQPPALPALPANADAAVDIALGNNPSIQAITANAQAAGYDVSTARSARLPTLAATGGSSYNNYLGTRAQSVGLPKGTPGIDNDVTQSRVGVALTVPLYQGGAVGARVRQAQALETASREQSIDVERDIIATTRAAFATYQATAEAITANAQAVSADELALQGVTAENSVGNRTVLEVLNAQQELLSARSTLVTAQRDHYVAGFALLNAMGRAQADNLNLDGGALYDPVAAYQRVRNSLGDFGDDPKYRPQATHTTGPTPADTDVQPMAPAPDLLTPLPGVAGPVTPPAK